MALLKRGFAILALFVAISAGAHAPAAPSPEYQIKAIFLFHFAQFVEWPERAFHGAHDPLVIGVCGEDPFGTFLDEAVRGEKIGEHPLVVRRYSRVEDIADCQILFISRSVSGQLDQILGRLKGRSVLTVGDLESFSRRGGIVCFVIRDNKIRLQINVEAAKGCALTISSKLLRPAMIVTTQKD